MAAMSSLEAEVEAAFDTTLALQSQGDWKQWVLTLTEDAVYAECEVGVMRGREAIAAVLNPAVSMIRGRFPPAVNWRTRREIRLISTLGLPTNFNAFSLNSAFKIFLFSPKRQKIISSHPSHCKLNLSNCQKMKLFG